MKTNILLIDPNTDFFDSSVTNKNGIVYNPTLPVPGSTGDAERIAAFLESEIGNSAQNLFVSLDKHIKEDISHFVYWRLIDEKHRTNASPHPMPYTPIRLSDLEDGYVTTTDPTKHEHALQYLKSLEEKGLEHWVFPLHCIGGTEGYEIFPVIRTAIDNWVSDKEEGRLHIFDKGENPDYEFFSPFSAEVVDKSVPETGLNAGLVSQILDCDKLYIFGEALSHCVMAGAEDIVSYVEFISDNEHEARETLSKISVISNMSSPVSGFEDPTKERLNTLKDKGVNVVTI